jgi:hypothetical protein
MTQLHLNDYTPDRWVVINFDNNGERFNKVLAEWKGGGMAGSDYWQMNSGITAVEDAGDYYNFHGASGSVYRCAKGRYGVTGLAASVLRDLLDKNSDTVTIVLLPEDTDWSQLEMVEKNQ